MKHVSLRTRCALALALAGMLAIGPAMAEKPSWAGGGKADKSERRHTGAIGSSDSAKPLSARADHFAERHRENVNTYYSERARLGRCPPGLAKKDNGCMPPGQAKKWQTGQPLARNVTSYQVPGPLATQLGRPPAGYHYTRVGSDILLVKDGSRTIVESILNLGRR